MSGDLAYLGLAEAAELIRAKKLSPVEYVTALLDRIKGRAADACIAADRFCTGYVFHARGAQMVLLVMDGRVIDKVFVAKT